MAHRVVLHRRTTSVANGAKRTNGLAASTGSVENDPHRWTSTVFEYEKSAHWFYDTRPNAIVYAVWEFI